MAHLDKLLGRSLSYCILHGWPLPKKGALSDIDIAIAPHDLGKLEASLQNGENGHLVQLLQHETSCYYFVLAMRNGGAPPRFVAVDAATDFRRDGRILFSGGRLLRWRRPLNGLWVAAPQVEFSYLLTKKILKRALPEHQRNRLQTLRRSLGDEAGSLAREMLGTRWGTRVAGWLAECAWDDFEAQLTHLRRALRWHVIKHDPFNPLRYWIPELCRLWDRWRHPTGLWIAVLGCDGAGKSTLIAHLEASLAGAFRTSVRFHWRPTIRGHPQEGPPATDPHGRPSHSPWRSWLKIAYYVVSYTVGYVLGVRPRLARSTMVLFDRYYDDLLVDPRRYRYGGSMRLATFAGRLIPRPDLYLVLDVPEDELRRRKQEVSSEELRRLQTAYKRLAADRTGAVLLDGSLSPEEVARAAADVVIEHLHHRYLSRRNHWFENNSASEALDWLASVLGDPSEDLRFAFASAWKRRAQGKRQRACSRFAWLGLEGGRAYLVPVGSDRAATASLALYNPQTFTARFAKELIASGLRLRLGQIGLPRVESTARSEIDTADDTRFLLLEYLEHVLDRGPLRVAVSLGTPGPHRKPVLALLTQEGDLLAYVKLGWNDVTNRLVEHEAEVLQHLSRLAFGSFAVPRVLHAGWWHGRYVCIQSGPGESCHSPSRNLIQSYLAIVQEMAEAHTQWMPLAASDFWMELGQSTRTVPNGYYRSVLEHGARMADVWLGDTPLPFHLSHGDFAPWNIKIAGGIPFLFDWEYARLAGPPGRDIFHFLFQTIRLLERRSWLDAYAYLQKDSLARVETYLASMGAAAVPVACYQLLYYLERLSTRAQFSPVDTELPHEFHSFVRFLDGLP